MQAGYPMLCRPCWQSSREGCAPSLALLAAFVRPSALIWRAASRPSLVTLCLTPSNSFLQEDTCQLDALLKAGLGRDPTPCHGHTFCVVCWYCLMCLRRKLGYSQSQGPRPPPVCLTGFTSRNTMHPDACPTVCPLDTSPRTGTFKAGHTSPSNSAGSWGTPRPNAMQLCRDSSDVSPLSTSETQLP